MARKAKTTESKLAVVQPAYKPPEDYVDYTSALIRYGLLMHEKHGNMDRKALDSGIDELYGLGGKSIDLSVVQVQYLNMRMAGMSTVQACKALEIDLASPLFWEEDSGKGSLYNCCVDALRRLEAIKAEDVTWYMAINNPNSNLERMFAIKSRLPEYRDNATSGGKTIVAVEISLGDKPFKIVTDTKNVGDITNE